MKDPPPQPFLIEGVLGSKSYLTKVNGSPKKPKGTPLSRPSRPLWPFWIFEVLKEGMIESKNLFSES